MAKFTQLHLGNNTTQENANKNQGKRPAFVFSKEKTLFGTGLLAVTVMSGVFLLMANGCSKGSSKAASTGTEQAASANLQGAMNSMAPTSAAAAVEIPAVTAKPAKKRVQRKAPLATYTEPAYGLSFRYPKNYILKTGEENASDLSAPGAGRMRFVEPGGVTVAAIEVPNSSYPGTDFTSGVFGVSVNSSVSRAQCEQFAFPKSDGREGDPATLPAKVKVGENEFAMVEDAGDSAKNEPHMKYFHHFENGNCYEFSAGLGTTDANVAGLKPVSRSLVFGRLEQILASVKVKPGVAPDVAKDAQGRPMVEGGKE
jgi:hypothetical protein